MRYKALCAAVTVAVVAGVAGPPGAAFAAGGGTVTGHLTDADGNPAAGAFVTARAADWSSSASTTTDASGAYTISGLAPNDYTVSFQVQGGVFTQYVHQRLTPADADRFAVSDGATVVADDRLVVTGTIAGTLLDEGGAPAPARIGIYTADGLIWVGAQDVAADGSFSLALPPAAYKLEFTIRGTLRQWNGGASSSDTAAALTVAAGQTLPLRETVLPTGTVAGRLTNADGSPAGGVAVTAQAPDWSRSQSATTDSDGRYSIGELTAGDYIVAFSGPHWVSQYAHAKLDRDAADRFAVAGGQTTTVDEQFLPTGTVRVRAHDETTGAPIAAFCVEESGGAGLSGCTDSGEVVLSEVFAGPHRLTVRAGDNRHFEREVAVTVAAGEQSVDAALRSGAVIHVPMVKRAGGTAAEGCVVAARVGAPFGYERGGLCSTGQGTPGTASLGPLEPGTYQVLADPDDDGLGLQWVGANGGTGDRDAAAQITVAAGDEVTLGAVRFDAAGSIRGRVTDAASGAPVEYTCVWVTAQPPWSSGDGCAAVTAADGTYTIAGLGPYAWPVQFVHRGYQWRWSGNGANRHEATAVTVAPGRSVAASIRLRTGGGTVTGTLRDAAGHAVGGTVYAFDAASGEAVQFGDGDGAGGYTIAMIAPQAIRLYYTTADGRSGWADGVYQIRNAKTLTVNVTVA